jgi:myo-inositol-1(or 4)-monophosphatase
MLDLKQLTTDVCRIATEVGSFLKEERKTFRRIVWWKNMHTIMCLMWIKNLRRVVKALTALLLKRDFITEKPLPLIGDHTVG